MERKQHLSLRVVACLLLLFSLLIPFHDAKASTISIKLVNYIGSRSSVEFSTQGAYQIGTRFSGKDRFEVAGNVAASGWQKADTVFVVNYLAFADALSAAPLAKKYDAPIFLTKPDALEPSTLSQIQSYNPTKIVIVGGTGSVTENVEAQLKNITSDVERIGGTDRFEVSKLVADQLGSSTSAIVTNGLVFSDALAIAPYAAQNQIPILLTYNNKLPDSIKAALQGKTSTLIIGGTGSVNTDVESQLASPTRIGGADRYEVSANIVKQLGLNADTVFLSNGMTFADALTGSVLAAKQGAPLLLVKQNELPTPVQTVMKDKGSTFINILGGPGSVSETVAGNLPNGSSILSDVKYSVKSENGRLALYKQTEKIKDFWTNPIIVGTTYSNQNKITLYGSSQKTYLGNMEFTLENGNVRPINLNLPVEDYLKGVVPIEMSPSWNVEALKAQAVAARTFVKRYDGGTIDDSQNYQVYGGYYGGSISYASKLDSVVDGTKDLVLRYPNSKGQMELITALFSSSNGGKVLSNTNTYGTTRVGYFQKKDDPYDLASPLNPAGNKQWSVTLYKQQINLSGIDMYHPYSWWDGMSENPNNADMIRNLKNGLVNFGYLDSKYDIKIVAIPELSFTTSFTNDQRIDGHMKIQYIMRDTSTTPYTYVTDDTGAVKVNELTIDRRAYDIRSMIGSSIMKSPYIKQVQDNADNWTFIGGGWGHGIGMSQFGANQMAADPTKKYTDILQFYYPGTTLGY